MGLKGLEVWLLLMNARLFNNKSTLTQDIIEGERTGMQHQDLVDPGRGSAPLRDVPSWALGFGISQDSRAGEEGLQWSSESLFCLSEALLLKFLVVRPCF